MSAIIPFEAPPSQLLILLTINWTLVWWLRSSLNNSGVIPANPGSESGVARAGIQEFERLLDTGFRRYDGEDLNDSFNELWFRTLGIAPFPAGQVGAAPLDRQPRPRSPSTVSI